MNELAGQFNSDEHVARLERGIDRAVQQLANAKIAIFTKHPDNAILRSRLCLDAAITELTNALKRS